MKRVLLAALLLSVAGGLAPASAQYYGPRGGYDDDGPPRYRRPPPPDDFGPRPYERRGGYDRGYDGGGRGDYGRGGPPRGGSVCVTSRGTCPIGAIVPRNSPCGCDVPGFGYKRGNAG